jgi:hypothetical protein
MDVRYKATAEEWESAAVRESVAGARSCGNHVCRPAVCHKGKLAQLGLCRLGFWSYRRSTNTKGEAVMKRVHGKELQRRWNRKGMPPVHHKPPHRGSARLERTQCFHFKMTPGTMLGPRCNHDLGVLAKFPVFTEAS